MIRIFKDNVTGEHVIQTTCLDVDSFTAELAEALANAINKGDSEIAMSILTNSMPIAFKLAGYKADGVSEQRTLICGALSPSACELVSEAGK
jgi:DeoR/GlpR family transcriptional regulator of sugar metabolism